MHKASVPGGAPVAGSLNHALGNPDASRGRPSMLQDPCGLCREGETGITHGRVVIRKESRINTTTFTLLIGLIGWDPRRAIRNIKESQG